MQQRRRLAPRSVTHVSAANPFVATITAIALGAAVAIGGNTFYQTQSGGIDPVEVFERTAQLSSGDKVVVEDAAIATQGGLPGAKTVLEFSSEEEFSVVGLTWEGIGEFATYIRSLNSDGTWGPWYSALPMEEISQSGKRGTDPIYVGSTKSIQVSSAGVDLNLNDKTPADEASQEQAPFDTPAAGAGIDNSVGEKAVELDGPPAPYVVPNSGGENVEEDSKPDTPEGKPPAVVEGASGGLADLPSNYGDIKPVAESQGPISAENIDVVLLDGNAQGGGVDMVVDSSNVNGMPNVITRAAWGANPNLSNIEYTPPVSAVTIHHTAGSSNYSEAEAPAIVRAIQTYHGSTLGWGDIGYNALADKYGNIYEGRAGGLDRAVQGAHVGGFNQNTWSISALGNYETAQPTQALLKALGELAGWKAAISGFDPKGSDFHSAEFDFSGSRFRRGEGGQFPNINAHRDFHYTTCPGAYLYAEMDTIRNIAKERYDQIKKTSSIASNSGATTVDQNDSEDNDSASTSNNSASTSNSGASTNSDTGSGSTTSSPSANSGASTAKPAPGTPTDLIQRLLKGDPAAIVAAIGTVAVIVLTLNKDRNYLGAGSSNVGDLDILNGLKVTNLPPLIDGLVKLSGDSDIERTWQSINNTFGPVLGQPTGGIHNGMGGPTPEQSALALFDNGLIVSDSSHGSSALWGNIADAWAGQGFDLGPLGMPTGSQYSPEENVFRADFEGGSITYNVETNKLHISTK